MSDLGQQEISLSYARGASSKPLPDGFMGFVDHPVVVDGQQLVVVPDMATAIKLSAETGTPQYYLNAGDALYLYPLPAVACTVKATVKIIPVLEMSDDLPWLGLFNDLIMVAAVQLATRGYALLPEPAFMAMIDKGVSSVLVPRMNPLPVRRPMKMF